MNILYVEDNPLDADILIRELARTAPQINVERVTTYAEAVAKLAACTPEQPVYEVVLTDMRLPDGNGLALPPLIQERGLPIAVVMLTGSGNDEAAVAALKAGAGNYVAKQGDYLSRLPAVLETARQSCQTEVARRARPLRVLYTECHAADIDLTRRHFAAYAPYIHLDIVHQADEALQQLCAPTTSLPSIDVLLLDYHLPGKNGLELLKELRQTHGLDLPIVFVTGQGNEEVAFQALRLGALDYVVKNDGYLYKLPAILENAFHRAQLIREQTALRRSVQDLHAANLALTQAYEATIDGLSHALDLRDKETEGHTQRVAVLTLQLAGALGLDEAECAHVRRGALLHDIGKLGVPDRILLKPDTLTDAEWEIMRKHPQYAYEMLSSIAYLHTALDIPYCHHEKWDGTGYPRRLTGEAIPLVARIFAVIDVWDALTSDRPYRPAWPKEKALEYIGAGAGTHFDPQVVKVFLQTVGRAE